jgi:hypothetical protein
VATHTGDVTVELRALLEEHCPDIAEEVLAAYRTASAVLARLEPASGAPGDPDAPAPLRWSHLSVGDVAGVDEVVGAVNAPLQAVAALLKVIAGILDVVSALLLQISDPVRALVMAAYQLLKEIIDDLLGSGCYLYADAPGVLSTAATVADLRLAAADPEQWKAGDPLAPAQQPDAFAGWAHTFERSFDDPGDENRPILSDGARVEAVFLVAAFPNLVDLRPVLPILATLFDLGAFQRAYDEWLGLPGFDQENSRLEARPVAPDWRSWKLRDIGPPDYPLRELERLPELLKGLLLNVGSIVDLLRNLVTAVRAKVAMLEELVAMIQRVVEMLQAITATGVHALAVSTDEGVRGLVRAFLDAEERPGTDEHGRSVPQLGMVGICLLAGTSTAATVPIWLLLGMDGAMQRAVDALQADAARHAEAVEAAAADLAASATAAWEGTGQSGSQPRDLGVTGLVSDFTDALGEAAAAGPELVAALGLDPAAADEAARSDRSALMARVEQAHAEGTRLDPRMLAQLEATRRARRRGSRSLVMRQEALNPPGGDA